MTLWRLPAAALSSMLERKEVSARDVVRSHLDRIDAVQSRLHALTDVFGDRALAEADESDARRCRGETRGPLDGVPVTFKECFDIAGRATTLGIPSWKDRTANEDAALVTALREAGAIVLGRTNLSQTMLYIEARNPLFGQTANPWSLAHSPGGSSGGEAAAVASGMSPLGVGTDIGGSIRTPCHFCGICGIAPTLDRLPLRGYQTAVRGQEAVRATAGPMARTVDDLALFFRALDPQHLVALDASVVPVPWRDPLAVRVEGLRVGTYGDDGLLPASAAIVRAIDRAAGALRSRGCEVQPFEPPDVRALLSDYFGVLSADGGATLLAELAGGDVDRSLQPLVRIVKLPRAIRAPAARAARIAGQPNLALLLEAIGRRSVAELWTMTDSLRRRRAALLDAMRRARLDVLVCPPYATPAFPHGGSTGFTIASSYSMAFNATQLPAGVVPVTRVRATEVRRVASRDSAHRRAAKFDELTVGLPVGVQVVAPPWRDDVVLAVMRAIESDVAGDDDRPRTPVDPP